MGRLKKDSKPLNVKIERDIHEQLEDFCEESGQSKTVAVERALLLYMGRSRAQSTSEEARENG